MVAVTASIAKDAKQEVLQEVEELCYLQLYKDASFLLLQAKQLCTPRMLLPELQVTTDRCRSGVLKLTQKQSTYQTLLGLQKHSSLNPCLSVAHSRLSGPRNVTVA